MNTQAALPGMEPPVEPVQQSLPGVPYIPGEKVYKAEGQEVLRNGKHYADAIDPDAASCIADALNGALMQADWAYMIQNVK